MTEQQEYEKFWLTFSEKLNDITDEYNKMSFANRKRAENAAKSALMASGIAGLINLANNPPHF